MLLQGCEGRVSVRESSITKRRLMLLCDYKPYRARKLL